MTQEVRERMLMEIGDEFCNLSNIELERKYLLAKLGVENCRLDTQGLWRTYLIEIKTSGLPNDATIELLRNMIIAELGSGYERWGTADLIWNYYDTYDGVLGGGLVTDEDGNFLTDKNGTYIDVELPRPN